jgi:maltose O-acetyltransferase
MRVALVRTFVRHRTEARNWVSHDKFAFFRRRCGSQQFELSMIRRLWSAILSHKRARYLARLQSRGLKIGKDVSIQDGVFFDPSHCYLIEVGARCVLAPNVKLIAHDASCKLLVGATRFGKIIIEEECFIGDSAIVLLGVTIGRGSIIGAGSVVTRSIPAGSVATGNPAKVISSVEDYAKRLTGYMAGGRTFSSDYWIRRSDEHQRDEMVRAATQGEAFIE